MEVQSNDTAAVAQVVLIRAAIGGFCAGVGRAGTGWLISFIADGQTTTIRSVARAEELTMRRVINVSSG
ncbi:hypothetical protein ACQP0C_42010 (plasmid) [Nocardia sp. CA-129566]|uniref:hypothetical protein n=1 Tax=Nocardia sp. CA-129566 TaxID=3239976 RepID=UPI003D98FC17